MGKNFSLQLQNRIDEQKVLEEERIPKLPMPKPERINSKS
jgi:hypothetical protein